jgi:mono/diheme cytochrome c family protein
METALEQFITNEWEPDQPLDPVAYPELKEDIVDLFNPIVEGWTTAEEKIVAPTLDAIPPADRTPEQLQASVDAGRELFYGKANCVKCHGPTGLGDGQQDNYDDWSNVNVAFIDNTHKLAEEIPAEKKALGELKGEERKAAHDELAAKQAELALRDELLPHILPPRRAIPRNLREGTYRGGRRDIDLFWRVFSGIPGMGMPNTGPSDPGGQGTLTEQEMWQVVDYIQSLPFESISRPQFAPVNTEAVN